MTRSPFSSSITPSRERALNNAPPLNTHCFGQQNTRIGISNGHSHNKSSLTRLRPETGHASSKVICPQVQQNGWTGNSHSSVTRAKKLGTLFWVADTSLRTSSIHQSSRFKRNGQLADDLGRHIARCLPPSLSWSLLYAVARLEAGAAPFSLQEVVGSPCKEWLVANCMFPEAPKPTPRDHGLAGSRARVELQAGDSVSEQNMVRRWGTYKVYFKCSSISIIAAWLPHL